jgi:hypothetical protein
MHVDLTSALHTLPWHGAVPLPLLFTCTVQISQDKKGLLHKHKNIYDQSVAISAYSTMKSNLHKPPPPQLAKLKINIKQGDMSRKNSHAEMELVVHT